MENNKKGNRIVFSILLILVITYNFTLYTQDISSTSAHLLSETALKGAHLWQENNCTACHQIYGLGGYLGPDLTNIASNPDKGLDYAKAFFNSGIKSMPQFHFTTEEKDHLSAFLNEIDQTGFYPNTEAEFNTNGWVTIQYK